MRGVLFPAGYVEIKAPLVFNKALWETSGHWQHYRQNMFLIEVRRRADGHEGHELPRPHARVRERGPQLSRPAGPVPRADAAPSQRSVRRAHRPDARAAVLAGRCPLLRDGGADHVGGGSAAEAGAAGLRRLRPAIRSQAVDPAGRIPGRGRHVGPRRGVAEEGARRGRPAVHDQRGGRRVLRAEDRLRHHRRASAASGSVRRSSSTIRCRSGSG